MEIKVRFFSFFREFTPEAELTVTLPSGSGTVGDLIQVLTERLGEGFAREVGRKAADNRELQALIFVGTESILNRQQLATPLKSGDTVKFLPPMAGG